MYFFRRFKALYCICCLQFFSVAAHSQNIDINLLKSINPRYPTAPFWKGTSRSYIIVSGTVSIGSLAYALIKNDRVARYKSYELIIAEGATIMATEALKLVNRTRPAYAYPGEVFALTSSSGRSFPSSHASLAFATATSLSILYKKWYVVVPAYLWAGCVGYSRMYLGMHYPSDVLGGAVVGAGSSLISHWLCKKLFNQKPAVIKKTIALY